MQASNTRSVSMYTWKKKKVERLGIHWLGVVHRVVKDSLWELLPCIYYAADLDHAGSFWPSVYKSPQKHPLPCALSSRWLGR